MNSMRFMLVGVTTIALATAAVAGEKSQLTASNGVIVDVYSDSFADRYEYTAPSIKFSEDGSNDNTSFALVAAVKKAGQTDSFVTGSIYYRGEWHRYITAVFKGGDDAPFTNTSRDVLSCRYGCSYSEGFRLEITPQQIKKYARDGVLQVQMRAASSNTALLSIPISYFDAVAEVSGSPSQRGAERGR